MGEKYIPDFIKGFKPKVNLGGKDVGQSCRHERVG
jgi:hypothetical protein